MAVPNDDRPRRDPAVQEQLLADELMLFRAEGGRVGVLNSTAAFVWARCDGEHTVERIRRELAESHAGAEGHDVAGEVDEALRALREGGLLTVG